jgi:hypothetical protein
MSSRIISASITTSATIERLTAEEEVTFYRLLTVVDDYGRFFADPNLLKSALYPRKGELTPKKVLAYLRTLVEVGLVTTYTVEEEDYLQIVKWDKHQRVRNCRSRYPEPPKDAGGRPQFADKCPQPAARAGAESESISESISESESITVAPRRDYSKEVIDLWNKVVVSLPKASVTPARKKMISARISECKEDLDVDTFFRSAFEDIQKSDFLTGRAGNWTGCGIDWCLMPKNWVKIREGNYKNRGNGKHQNFEGHGAEYYGDFVYDNPPVDPEELEAAKGVPDA